ncbi:hypothetical protein ARMGADRAFT_1086779 [Armillaria gallica]|uniref:Uncharacterized protein n=1 Tax=Armillaria gallica TaxID=47427 RepID=A0A2H3DB55_ARMGA|nr:hypothetical protein ARMGADRAFT_1086779 [Armillaria gallica]
MKLKLEGSAGYLQQWFKTNTNNVRRPAPNHFSYEHRLRLYVQCEIQKAIKAPSFSTIPTERTNATADTILGHRLLSAEGLSQRSAFRHAHTYTGPSIIP